MNLTGRGAVITLEYDDFHLVCVYAPNSQEELKRLEFRLSWEDAFLTYIKELDAYKSVVVCGDLNVAHQPIDLKNPAQNRRNAGFSDEERESFTMAFILRLGRHLPLFVSGEGRRLHLVVVHVSRA